MRFSKGVVTFGWPPQMRAVLHACDEATREILGREGRVTSGREGDHQHPESWHYERERPTLKVAFDLRIWPRMKVWGRPSATVLEQYRFALQRELDGLPPSCGNWRVVKESTHMHLQGEFPMD